MYKEQGGEITLAALFVTYASGFRKERQARGRQSQFQHIEKKKFARAVQVRNVRWMKYDMLNSPPQSIMSKFLTEVG